MLRNGSDLVVWYATSVRLVIVASSTAILVAVTMSVRVASHEMCTRLTLGSEVEVVIYYNPIAMYRNIRNPIVAQ